MVPVQIRVLAKGMQKCVPFSIITYHWERDKHPLLFHAAIAQKVEQLLCNQQAGGSIPSSGSKRIISSKVELLAHNRFVLGSNPR